MLNDAVVNDALEFCQHSISHIKDFLHFPKMLKAVGNDQGSVFPEEL